MSLIKRVAHVLTLILACCGNSRNKALQPRIDVTVPLFTFGSIMHPGISQGVFFVDFVKGFWFLSATATDCVQEEEAVTTENENSVQGIDMTRRERLKTEEKDKQLLPVHPTETGKETFFCLCLEVK